MTYDTFMFYNELDLLEIRLNILDPYVDTFVIVEARETFVGHPKPLYFEENRERYARWAHKIIHYVVDNSDEALWEFARKSPNVGNGEHWWVREFYQKENILKAFTANDDDLVFVSDVDEIWNPALDYSGDGVWRPRQIAYHYYLNNKSDQYFNGWTGTRAGKYKKLKEVGVNHFRTEQFTPSKILENGGWHFTNLGDVEFVKKKIESYGHQEYNVSGIKGKIDKAFKNNEDFLGRCTLWVDETGLPQYILDNKEKYKHLFK